jgi:hypothetical protein
MKGRSIAVVNWTPYFQAVVTAGVGPTTAAVSPGDRRRSGARSETAQNAADPMILTSLWHEGAAVSGREIRCLGVPANRARGVVGRAEMWWSRACRGQGASGAPGRNSR